jgi:hypothetical protein
MFALSNRPFRNAGLALYGLGSLASLGMISNQASAQTLANNNQPASGVVNSEVCDPFLKDRSPAGIEKYVACEINEIRRRTEASRQRGVEADMRAECTASLIAEIKSSPARFEASKALMGGRSIRDVDPCAVLIQLRRG